MATKYYAAEPMFITLSDNKGTLLYNEVVWNIMRMFLMEEEGVDAESALKMLDEMEETDFRNLKEVAEQEYASPEFQEYLERVHLYPGTENAPKLHPVEELLMDEDKESPLTEAEANKRLMEVLNEFPWGMFKVTYLESGDGME